MDRAIDGTTLRQAIRIAGYTMQAFADAIGVTRRTLYFYIQGQRVPRLRRLLFMANLLKVDVKEILSMQADREGIAPTTGRQT